MNQLFPIIRRVRRPLLPVEPVKTQQTEPASVKPDNAEKPKASDGDIPEKEKTDGDSTNY